MAIADQMLAQDEPQVDFKLQSDAAGTITRIGVKIPCEVIDHPDPRFRYFPDQHAAYDALLRALASAGMSIVAVARNDHVQIVKSWLGRAGFAGRSEIQPAPAGKYNDCDTWARDCLLSANKTDGSRTLLHPYTSLDGDLASWFSKALHAPLEPLEFNLDGGSSLVVDDQTWIVGAEAINAAMENDGSLLWDDAIQRIAAATGRTPIVAGFTLQDVPSQLLFVHQRFIRIARKRQPPGIENASRLRRFLATIRSGISAATTVVRDLLTPDMLYSDKGLWSHIDMIVSVTGVSPNGKPVLLVADPTLPQCPQRPDSEKDRYNTVVSELKGVVRVLAAANCFEIRPIPAPFSNGGVLGYANTIVQKDAVMIPGFTAAGHDFAAADQRNFEIWHVDLQVPTVVQVPGWFAYAGSQGGIRCATLSIDRAP